MIQILSLFLVLLLALVHLSVKRFTSLMSQPRKPLLSFAGGTSVGYITVHLLPEFQKVQDDFNRALLIPEQFRDFSLFIIATIGFLAFYSLNHFVKAEEKNASGKKETSRLIFQLHIGAFALYNSFIGYYLIKGLKQEPKALLFFTVIFILHLMVNDVGIRMDHKKRYDPYGSIILGASIIGGWLLGVFLTLPIPVYAIWFSWLSGGILLNTIKEELPKERKSQLLPFILGALFSTVLFLFI